MWTTWRLRRPWRLLEAAPALALVFVRVLEKSRAKVRILVRGWVARSWASMRDLYVPFVSLVSQVVLQEDRGAMKSSQQCGRLGSDHHNRPCWGLQNTTNFGVYSSVVAAFAENRDFDVPLDVAMSLPASGAALDVLRLAAWCALMVRPGRRSCQIVPNVVSETWENRSEES